MSGSPFDVVGALYNDGREHAQCIFLCMSNMAQVANESNQRCVSYAEECNRLLRELEMLRGRYVALSEEHQEVLSENGRLTDALQMSVEQEERSTGDLECGSSGLRDLEVDVEGSEHAQILEGVVENGSCVPDVWADSSVELQDKCLDETACGDCSGLGGDDDEIDSSGGSECSGGVDVRAELCDLRGKYASMMAEKECAVDSLSAEKLLVKNLYARIDELTSSQEAFVSSLLACSDAVCESEGTMQQFSTRVLGMVCELQQLRSEKVGFVKERERVNVELCDERTRHVDCRMRLEAAICQIDGLKSRYDRNLAALSDRMMKEINVVRKAVVKKAESLRKEVGGVEELHEEGLALLRCMNASVQDAVRDVRVCEGKMKEIHRRVEEKKSHVDQELKLALDNAGVAGNNMRFVHVMKDVDFHGVVQSIQTKHTAAMRAMRNDLDKTFRELEIQKEMNKALLSDLTMFKMRCEMMEDNVPVKELSSVHQALKKLENTVVLGSSVDCRVGADNMAKVVHGGVAESRRMLQGILNSKDSRPTDEFYKNAVREIIGTDACFIPHGVNDMVVWTLNLREATFDTSTLVKLAEGLSAIVGALVYALNTRDDDVLRMEVGLKELVSMHPQIICTVLGEKRNATQSGFKLKEYADFIKENRKRVEALMNEAVAQFIDRFKMRVRVPGVCPF